MRYWAALTAYEDSNEHCPVFVPLASYAAFVDAGLKEGKGQEALDMMAYLKKFGLRPLFKPSVEEFIFGNQSAEFSDYVKGVLVRS